jgi:hypothetical protein
MQVKGNQLNFQLEFFLPFISKTINPFYSFFSLMQNISKFSKYFQKCFLQFFVEKCVLLIIPPYSLFTIISIKDFFILFLLIYKMHRIGSYTISCTLNSYYSWENPTMLYYTSREVLDSKKKPCFVNVFHSNLVQLLQKWSIRYK